MNRQISLSQYRTVDLTVLAVLMCIAQVLIHFASTAWFQDQLYVVSPVGIIVAMVMMRWGIWGGIHALLGGCLYVFLSGGNMEHYLIFGAGNLLSLLALVLLKLMGKERIRTNVVYTLLFGFCVQSLMLLGRGAVAYLLGKEVGACVLFITTDALSILFTLCGVWVIRRVDGLFEDQIQYLLRVQREQPAKGGEQL